MAWLNKPATTGVDLGVRSIKGVKLLKAHGRVQIDKFFFHDLAAANAQFPLVPHPEQILGAAVQTNRLQDEKVSSAIGLRDLLSYELTIPRMPEKEAEAAVLNDVEGRIKFPLEEACVTFAKIRSFKDGETEKLLLKPYCARRNKIVSQMDLLKSVKLTPEFVEPEVLALTAMLSFNEYIEKNKAYIVIDLGESQISVLLISDEKVLLTNTFPKGMGAINKALLDNMDLAYEDAEKVKLGFNLDEAAEQADPKHSAPIDEFFSDLFYRLQRLIMLFRVQVKDQPIERILLTGGGSKTKGLELALHDHSDIETVAVNPLKNIDLRRLSEADNARVAGIAHHLGTAVGLALRGI